MRFGRRDFRIALASALPLDGAVASPLLYCPLCTLAIALLWRRRRAFAGPPTAVAAAVVGPLLLGLLAYTYGQTLLLSVRWSWSAERLAPSIGLFHGYPLYTPRDSGPINGWIHGPVAPLLWTPAALAHEPLPALTIAAVINLTLLLLPLLLASLRFTPPGGPARLLPFAFAAAGLLLLYPTWYMASALCTDAVAVGLGLGSCLVLLAGPPHRPRALLLAAVLAVLAAWTKQIEAPIILAQLLWLALAAGRRTAARYAAVYAGAGVVISAVLLGAFHPRDVILNMWTIPTAQKLGGGWAGAGLEVWQFLGYSLLFSAPCVLGLCWFAGPGAPAGPAAPFRRALGLLLAVAVVLLPLGAMASIKVGGDRNSIHSVYYLAAAALVAFGQAWRPDVRAAGLARTATLATAAVTGVLAARLVHSYPSLSMLPPRCLSQEAYLYARENPLRTYFAQDPLATLLAEGRMYHFDYAVLDRKYGGVVTTPAHIRADLPPQLEMIVYPRAEGPKEIVSEYLTDYVFVRATEDWLIYRRRAPKP